MSTAWFFLPHSDDEVFALAFMLEEMRRGIEPICFFLTSGVIRGGGEARRDRDSARNLRRWGLPAESLVFVGTRLGIPDGLLPRDLEAVVGSVLDGRPRPERIYCPAWEGGHQDHDAAHLLGVAAAVHHARVESTFGFFTYNGHRTKGRFFRVAAPIGAPAGLIEQPVPVRLGLRIAFSSRAYRNQWSTWVGLLPPLLVYLLSAKSLPLEPVSVEKLAARPHPGPLLYERYRRMCFTEFCALTAGFVASRITGPLQEHRLRALALGTKPADT